MARGSQHGEAVRASRPVPQRILEGVNDDTGIPLQLERFMTQQSLREYDLNLPLDEAASARLALFSREEAIYWLANVTSADPTLRSRATSGLRIALCGEAGDKRIVRVLEKIRARS